MLKASALGAAISDDDVKILRAAADAEDRDLSCDELACRIVLREIRARRQRTMAAVNSARAAGQK